MLSDQVCNNSESTTLLSNEFLVIQGTADSDIGGKLTEDSVIKLTQGEVTKTVDFCLAAFDQTPTEKIDGVMKKLEGMKQDPKAVAAKTEDLEKFTEDELKILNHIRARQMLRMEDSVNIDNFGRDSIDGLVPNLKQGALTLLPEGDVVRDKLSAPVVDLLRLVNDPAAAKGAETVAAH
jgi:hypothetical protein